MTNDEQQRQRLERHFVGPGVAAANRAVRESAPDSSLIFLTKSDYQDLIYWACLPELKTYKGKKIVVTSDPIESIQ